MPVRQNGSFARSGTDSQALLAAADAHGLTSTGSRHFRISVLGANYEDRLFAYPSEGFLNIILPSRLREIAHEVICEVFISVKGKDLFEQLQADPGLSIQSVYPDDLDAAAWAQRPSNPRT